MYKNTGAEKPLFFITQQFVTMTWEKFTQQFKTVDVWLIAYNILRRHEKELIGIQKSQLWAGMNADGKKLTPNVLQDPYFVEKANKINKKRKKKKVAASDLAKHWADNKLSELNSSYSGLPFYEAEFGKYNYGDVNLIFSTGDVVWKHIDIMPFGRKDLTISLHSFDLLQELETKYGEVFGLNPQGVEYMINTFFKEEFINDFWTYILE
ncbi:MAG: hypothetical protein LBP63_10815 [Prevotellaceae bacterium]|jgi:hypothetical protein|nr:hypothetical protein [Prevotellaceae bacterium]